MVQQLRSIQALRALAVLMVVFFHLSAAEQEMGTQYPVMLPFLYFGYGGVEVFFVISGFIMVYISQGKFGEPGAWADFLQRRLLRIYPMYWAVLIGTAVFFIFQFDVTQCNDPGGLARAAFLLTPQNCFLRQAWSLHYEVVFYGIFAAVLFLGARRGTIFLGAISAFVIAVLAVSPSALTSQDPIPSHLRNFLYFMPGCLAALALVKKWRRHATVAVLLGVLGMAAGAMINAIGLMDTESFLARFLQFSVPSAFLVYGLVAIEFDKRLQMARFIVLIGDSSYAIYLTHLTTFPQLRRWLFALPDSLSGHLAWVTGMAIGAVAFGIITHLAIEKPLLRLLRKISLRRKVEPVMT